MQPELNIPARATSNKIPAPECANTQRGRILRVLLEARGGWVPSPEIAACAQQYGARVYELRRLNFGIKNRTEELNGTRLSWFRLVSSPAQASSPATPATVDRAVAVNSQTKSAGDVTSDPRARQLSLF
jgi:hypothetical protein